MRNPQHRAAWSLVCSPRIASLTQRRGTRTAPPSVAESSSTGLPSIGRMAFMAWKHFWKVAGEKESGLCLVRFENKTRHSSFSRRACMIFLETASRKLARSLPSPKCQRGLGRGYLATTWMWPLTFLDTSPILRWSLCRSLWVSWGCSDQEGCQR